MALTEGPNEQKYDPTANGEVVANASGRVILNLGDRAKTIIVDDQTDHIFLLNKLVETNHSQNPGDFSHPDTTDQDNINAGYGIHVAALADGRRGSHGKKIDIRDDQTGDVSIELITLIEIAKTGGDAGGGPDDINLRLGTVSIGQGTSTLDDYIEVYVDGKWSTDLVRIEGNLARDLAAATGLLPNGAPIAVDDAFFTVEDMPVGGAVLANDSDPDDDALTASLLSGPANGTLTFDADGTFDYTPNADFAGTDSFTYEVSDGEATSQATVTIEVAPQNDPATISGDATGLVTEDGDSDQDPATSESTSGLLVVSDVDAGEDALVPVMAGTVGGNGYGTFEVLADGSWSYTLDNANAAVQGLDDGDTLTDSLVVSSADGTATETITVTIAGANEPPDPCSGGGSFLRVPAPPGDFVGGRPTYLPELSGDGSKLAFTSETRDPNNPNAGVLNVHVKDLLTGEIVVASVAADGSEGDRNSGIGSGASLSYDGTFVAFSSRSSTFSPIATTFDRQVYAKNLNTGEITLVSVTQDGTPGLASSFDVSISGDGMIVAFDGNASNLVSQDSNVHSDVYVKNLSTGEIVVASTESNGTIALGGQDPVLSADGTRVAFLSTAATLVAGDTNGYPDIFVKDLVTGETFRASAAADGTGANAPSGVASISADGRLVAFQSHATNLIDTNAPPPNIGNPFNSAGDIFVKNLETGEVTLVNSYADGTRATFFNSNAEISEDGTRVIFEASGVDDNFGAPIDPSKTVAVNQIYIKNLVTGELTRVSNAIDGTQSGASGSFMPTLSADGSVFAFTSYASDLVENDDNSQSDTFVNTGTSGCQSVHPLFTVDADIVDFNSLTAGSYVDGTQYDGLSGSDHVTLPSNAASAVAAGYTTGSPFNAGDGEDTIIGGTLDDEISGGAGDDLLEAGTGADTLAGGPDNDRMIVNDLGSGDSVNGEMGLDTLVTSVAPGPGRLLVVGNTAVTVDGVVMPVTEVERFEFTGADGADRFITISGDDLLQGLGGNDTLEGGTGTDTIDGGAGNDLAIVGDLNGDQIDGGIGDDTVWFQFAQSVDLDLDAGTAGVVGGTGTGTVLHVENAIVQGPGGAIVGGDAALNRLTVSGVGNTILGRDGNDVITVDAGGNVIDGGPGAFDRAIFDTAADVTVDLAAGTTSVNGDAGTIAGIEWLLTGQGNDTVTGSDDGDRIEIDRGADLVAAGHGDDLIILRDGGDEIDGGGGEGDALFVVTAENTTIDLDAGTLQIGSDPLSVVTGVEDVRGGSGNDAITGSSAQNSLTGMAGNDTLTGGSDDPAAIDNLDGGYGLDTLVIAGAGVDTRGGADADTFVFRQYTPGAPQVGQILDFNAADGDRIDVTDWGVTETDILAGYADLGVDSQVVVGDLSILLRGIDNTEFSTSFFDLVV